MIASSSFFTCLFFIRSNAIVSLFNVSKKFTVAYNICCNNVKSPVYVSIYVDKESTFVLRGPLLFRPNFFYVASFRHGEESDVTFRLFPFLNFYFQNLFHRRLFFSKLEIYYFSPPTYTNIAIERLSWSVSISRSRSTQEECLFFFIFVFDHRLKSQIRVLGALSIATASEATRIRSRDLARSPLRLREREARRTPRVSRLRR